MPDKNISQRVLEAIKEKLIKPKPKWRFLLKNYLVWALGALSLLVGSLACSVIIYMLINNDWDIYRNINNSLLEFILATLPYFWLVFLGLFIFIAHYNIKHTKKGYRLNLRQLIIGAVLISMLLGSLFYNIGLGQFIDDSLTYKIPLYRQFLNPRKRIWLEADKGLLAGIITEVSAENSFKIIDINKKEWSITGEAMFAVEPSALEPGSRVRIMGRKIDDKNFEAFKVMPALLHRPLVPDLFGEPFEFKDKMPGPGMRPGMEPGMRPPMRPQMMPGR